MLNSDKLVFRLRLNQLLSSKKKTAQSQNSLDQSDEIYLLKSFQEQLLNNLVLRGIKLGDSKIGEFQKYNIRKNKIENGSYSNQLELNNDNIIANNIIRYEDDRIQKTNTQQIILDNFSKYYDKTIVYNNTKNQFRMNFSTMIKFINLILFFFCLFIIFFNKKYLDRKQNNSMPVLICFGLLIYSLIINSVKMSEYNFIFAIFTFIFFILIFIKFQKYE